MAERKTVRPSVAYCGRWIVTIAAYFSLPFIMVFAGIFGAMNEMADDFVEWRKWIRETWAD